MTGAIAMPQLRTHQEARIASRAIEAVVILGALLVGWLTVAPTAVGGPASYVVTDGTSMLPHFVADGLVITRKRQSYHTGEVVAYHNKKLHEVVMHRIVARDGDRFVFKGDNNHFRDRYHPTKAELVGKEWVYWPGAGRYLKMLRNPMTFAVIVGLFTVFSVRLPKRNRRRRRHHAW
ncbi:MAG TPA: S24/S26 family peptidase [Nocardioidaceae bacterium]|nr:S24/S26 family peptidase [Nocardioidaceae bacterium]